MCSVRAEAAGLPRLKCMSLASGTPPLSGTSNKIQYNLYQESANFFLKGQIVYFRLGGPRGKIETHMGTYITI